MSRTKFWPELDFAFIHKGGAPRRRKKNFVSETDPTQTRAGINNPFRGQTPLTLTKGGPKTRMKRPGQIFEPELDFAFTHKGGAPRKNERKKKKEELCVRDGPHTDTCRNQ